MKVLLLTVITKKKQKMLYDIIREFTDAGNEVFVVCPADDINDVSDKFVKIEDINYMFVNNGNLIGKVNYIKKIANFLLTDIKYKNALKKELKEMHFDVVLYSTPPITLVNTIRWIKKSSDATTYLMLKDIFPQNAVDMGMLKKNGLMGLVWRYFRQKEKKLYDISDFIGCMSQANCRYILDNNNIESDKIGICVNAYANKELKDISIEDIRNKYNIPIDKVVFLYGGNLGKPQGLDFVVKILNTNKNRDDMFFLICGNGNEEQKIKSFIKNNKPENVKYIETIPSDEFDDLCRACDIGMIFLDYRFTIPNFPSRMLSYMINEKPIVAATDCATDINEVIQQGDMGWWCESNNVEEFNRILDDICKNSHQIEKKGKNARAFFENNYTSKIAYSQIYMEVKKRTKRKE